LRKGGGVGGVLHEVVVKEVHVEGIPWLLDGMYWLLDGLSWLLGWIGLVEIPIVIVRFGSLRYVLGMFSISVGIK